MDKFTSVIQGLVRPLVTLAFAGAMAYGFLVGLIAPGEFMGMAGIALGFYFQGRQNGKPTEAPQVAPPVDATSQVQVGFQSERG